MLKTTSSLIIHNNKVLLLLRDNKPTIPFPNKWQAIGGHVEEGESFDEAIKREIEEETNLTPATITYKGKLITKDAIYAFYICYATDEEVKQLKLGNEGQDLRFFSLEEIKDLDVSFTVKVYFEKYFDQLVKVINVETVKPEELGLVY